MIHPPLPGVMVAPNGARRSKKAHPALPLSVDELVGDALACRAVGAGGVHAHVRDGEGIHVLDADQYRDLYTRMRRESPGFYVQATSEKAGRYDPMQQRAFLARLPPCPVAIAVRELLSDGDDQAARRVYRRSGVDVQHILYDFNDAARLARSILDGIVPDSGLKILIVHGKYGAGQTPGRSVLDRTLAETRRLLGPADYAVCSFGVGETGILRHVLVRGGKVRVWFEKNIHSEDGCIATSNAARIAEVMTGP